MTIAALIKEFRKKSNLSQAQLADLVGTSAFVISRLEAGKNPRLAIGVYYKLFKLLNNDSDEVGYRGNYKTVLQSIIDDFSNGMSAHDCYAAKAPDLTVEEQSRLYAELRKIIEKDEQSEAKPEEPPLANAGKREFYIMTPLGALKVWANQGDVDIPDEYPGVFVDWIDPNGTQVPLALVEYDSDEKGIYGRIYGNDEYGCPVENFRYAIIDDQLKGLDTFDIEIAETKSVVVSVKASDFMSAKALVEQQYKDGVFTATLARPKSCHALITTQEFKSKEAG